MSDEKDPPEETLSRTSISRDRRPNPKTLQVARRVRRLMEAKGWIPSDLSRHSGVDRRILSNLFTGQTRPNRKNMFSVAQALGVPVEALDSDRDDIYSDVNTAADSFSITLAAGRPGYMLVRMERVVRWRTAHKIQALVLEDDDGSDEASVG